MQNKISTILMSFYVFFWNGIIYKVSSSAIIYKLYNWCHLLLLLQIMYSGLTDRENNAHFLSPPPSNCHIISVWFITVTLDMSFREHNLNWQLIRKKSCMLTTILVFPLLDLLLMQDSYGKFGIWLFDWLNVDLF